MRTPSCFQLFLVVLLLCAAPALADEAGAPDGALLYARHCAACHQALEKTVLTGRPVSRIRSAIRHFAVMSKLKTLEEVDLQAIAVALAAPEVAAK